MQKLQAEEKELTAHRKSLLQIMSQTSIRCKQLQAQKDKFTVELVAILDTVGQSNALMEEHRANNVKIEEMMATIRRKKVEQRSDLRESVSEDVSAIDHVAAAIPAAMEGQNERIEAIVNRLNEDINHIKNEVIETKMSHDIVEARHEKVKDNITAKLESQSTLNYALNEIRMVEMEIGEMSVNYEHQMNELDNKSTTEINELMDKIKHKKRVFEELKERRRRLNFHLNNKADDRRICNIESTSSSASPGRVTVTIDFKTADPLQAVPPFFAPRGHQVTSNDSRLKSARVVPTPRSSITISRSETKAVSGGTTVSRKRVRFCEQAKVTGFRSSDSPSVLRNVKPRTFSHADDSRRPTFIQMDLNDT